MNVFYLWDIIIPITFKDSSTTVYLLALTPNGQKVGISVLGFVYEVYIYHPNSDQVYLQISQLSEEDEFTFSSTKVLKKRFLSGVEQQFLKITFPNKIMMNKVCKEIKSSYEKCEIFENDIDDIIRFSVQSGIRTCSWFSAPKAFRSRNTNFRHVHTELVDYITNFNPLPEMETRPPPTFTVCAYDIETEDFDPEKSKVIQISMSFQEFPFNTTMTDRSRDVVLCLETCEKQDDLNVLVFDTEKNMLQKFFDIMIRHEVLIFAGYNNYSFDTNFLYKRCDLFFQKNMNPFNTFSFLNGRNGLSKYEDKMLSSSAFGNNKLTLIKMFGRIELDVFLCIKKNVAIRLSSYKLNAVSQELLGMQKDDVSYEFMKKAWARKDSKDLYLVAKYCLQDAWLVMCLLQRLKEINNTMAMASLTRVPMQYICTRGQGIKTTSLLYKEVYSLNFVWTPADKIIVDEDDLLPKDPKNQGIKTRQQVFHVSGESGMNLKWTHVEDDLLPKDDEEESYQGAVVIDAKVDLHNETPVCVLDFKSLYPSIMIAYNLSPETYQKTRSSSDDLEVVLNETTNKTVYYKQGELGIVPTVLKRLWTTRDDIKKAMKKVDPKSIEYSLLDAQQLAVKVTSNSAYGYFGASKGFFPLKNLASSVTSIGRSSIIKAKTYAETKGFTCLYGDSVASYTPVFIRQKISGNVELCTIEDITRKYGNDEWIQCTEQGKQTKQVCILNNIETWTERGWTDLERVIRHTLAPSKKMIRILTHTGLVDVTDDHSLVRSNGEMVKPTDVFVGTELLHHSLPQYINIGENTLSFSEGMCIDIDLKDQLQAAKIYWFAKHQGYNVFIDVLDKYKCKLTMTKNSQRKNPIAIKKIIPIQYSGYVYDLTSSNHHFAAGIGQIIVHNTDSIMVTNYNEFQHKNIPLCMEAGSILADKITENLFNPPMELEFEKIYFPYLLVSKKRYVGGMFTKPSSVIPEKYDQKGLVTVRRDNAPIVSKTASHIINIMMNTSYNKKQIIKMVSEYIVQTLNDLVDGKFDIRLLTISKEFKRYPQGWLSNDLGKDLHDNIRIIFDRSKNEKEFREKCNMSLKINVPKLPIPLTEIYRVLSSSYKSPSAHGNVSLKRKLRDPANTPSLGERVSYVIVPSSQGSGDVCECSEDPEFVVDNGLSLDYKYYIEKQLRNPLVDLISFIMDKKQANKIFNDAVCRINTEHSRKRIKLDGQKSIHDFFRKKT
jgi:DNA polymerase elongation subunit (family B)